MKATLTSNTKNKYYAKLTVEEVGQSIADNTTTLSYTLTLYVGANSFSGYTIGYQVKINGVTVKEHDNSDAKTSMSANSSKKVCSGTYTVHHNDDGKKDVALYLKIFTNNESYLPVSLSGSGSMTLTRINRGIRIKVDGSYKRALVYVKEGGSYKLSLPYVKTDGSYKLGVG